MTTRLLAFVSVILALGTPGPLWGVEGPDPLAGLRQVDLSHVLVGDASFETGRVVLVTRAGPGSGPEASVVTVLDAQGFQILESMPGVDIPDVSRIGVLAAALRTPDRLVVSAAVESTEMHHASVLLEYDVASGALVRVTRTNPIQCYSLRGDADGTLWCLGHPIEREEQFDLVYRFGPDGDLLGSSLPRATYPSAPMPWRDTDASTAGFVSGHDVLLWLPEVRELVTFSGDGVVRRRVVVPAPSKQFVQEGFTVLPDGEVVLLRTVAEQSRESGPYRNSLYRLAADGEPWTPVADLPSEIPGGVSLIGADEDGLVLLSRRTQRLIWYPVSASAP